MILQSLVSYYDRLFEQGVLQKPGWQDTKVGFALRIDEEGMLRGVVDLREMEEGAKTPRLLPKHFGLPLQVKRSSGIAANFLCDSMGYMLGVDEKGKPERAVACFAASASLHHLLLDGVEAPQARAILRFFDTWKPQEACSHELLDEKTRKEMGTANLIFMVGDQYAHDEPQIRAAWQRRYEASPQTGGQKRCLVTGEMDEIARLHASIKGVRGAQSSGASMVSFNVPSFESYGFDGLQGLNAPVGERAAFAYTTALNHLLSRREHTVQIGDTTVVFWAEDAQDAYAQMISMALGGSETVGDAELLDAMRKLTNGLDAAWEDIPLHPENRFYILGLAPNASRLSVRFFMQDSFGAFARHLRAHHERMEIVRPSNDTKEWLSVRKMLDETANPNATVKAASAQMAGDTLRAILTDGAYPVTLYQQVQLRIRAGDEVRRGKAAIVKAYLSKNMPDGERKESMKGAMEMKLNEDTAYMPYLLGRLFSMLEALQEAANPGINTTIRDRYFTSGCCTPAIVFPTLLNLAQAHLKKVNEGTGIYFDKELGGVMGMMDESYPKQLDIYDQGIFQLGYYHQKQKRFTKKEEK